MGKHFRFVHCADLHLGAPFRGIQSGDKGPWTDALEKATFRAFENVVDWTEEIRADALIIAGDVYNSNEHSLSAQLSFARELYRLAQAGIPVLWFMEIMTREMHGRQIFRFRLQFTCFHQKRQSLFL